MLKTRWFFIVAAALLAANSGCGKPPKGEATNGSGTSGSGQTAAGSKSMSSGAGGAGDSKSASGDMVPGKGEVNEGILHTSEGWVLTEDDNGKYLVLHPGEMVLVRVGASTTNGYTWEVGGDGSSVLKQIGESMYAAGTADSKTDRTQTWKYQAAKMGEGTVEMKYLPPYSKSVPERVLKFTVAVK